MLSRSNNSRSATLRCRWKFRRSWISGITGHLDAIVISLVGAHVIQLTYRGVLDVDVDVDVDLATVLVVSLSGEGTMYSAIVVACRRLT